MLTRDEQIDLIDDLVDNDCLHALAGMARSLVTELDSLRHQPEPCEITLDSDGIHSTPIKRKKPCEWCMSADSLDNYLGDCGGMVDVTMFNFCPACGRRLGE